MRVARSSDFEYNVDEGAVGLRDCTSRAHLDLGYNGIGNEVAGRLAGLLGNAHRLLIWILSATTLKMKVTGPIAMRVACSFASQAGSGVRVRGSCGEADKMLFACSSGSWRASPLEEKPISLSLYILVPPSPSPANAMINSRQPWDGAQHLENACELVEPIHTRATTL